MDSVATKKRRMNKGSWTGEEDRKLAEAIAENGPKKWTTIASKAGLGRCGKSCRLRWMNYLRPNIKRGNISDQEEDLIRRLHKLIGNRWSLIAGRLPGRTDNEIKNYWNSHLSKKQTAPKIQYCSAQEAVLPSGDGEVDLSSDDSSFFNVDDLFDFSSETDHSFNWVLSNEDARFSVLN